MGPGGARLTVRGTGRRIGPDQVGDKGAASSSKGKSVPTQAIRKGERRCDIYVLLQKGAVMGFPAALLANYQVPSQFIYGVDSAGECYL